MKNTLVLLALLTIAATASARSTEAAPPPHPGAGGAEGGGDTLRRVVILPVSEVSTTRFDERSSTANDKLGAAAIRRGNYGQDSPMLLANMAGAYAYSDAGNGIGYSYLTLRGFPQRRISVLVNGIPLNDPESHEVWWIDHPDLFASAEAVTVQRGAGAALYGAAALGGTVNVETGAFERQPRLTASTSVGSFGTRRIAFEGVSGTLRNDWNVQGRYSRIETDGYRDRSWSRLWSYAFSARRTTLDQQWDIRLYGGPENTHLAYLGISRDRLEGRVTGDADRDRRFNPIAYEGEQDHFFEPHYEIEHTRVLGAHTTLTQTAFWFDGRGYYDEQRLGRSLADYRLAPWLTTDTTIAPHDYYALDGNGHVVLDGQGRATIERTDLVRRREVVNRHFGWLPRLRRTWDRGATTLGGELRFHDGRHVGRVLSGTALTPGTAPDVAYYDYHPRTLSAGLFAREEWDARADLRVTADLAWRHQGYQMRDDRFDGIRFDQTYDFANPKLGLAWTPSERWSAFASVAMAAREPAFRDLYDAEGAGSLPLYGTVDVANGVYENPLVKPEHVRDYEAGATWRSAQATASVVAYHMAFDDELVWAGQYNSDLGYPILGNAAKSVHQGLELSGAIARPLGAAKLDADANVTLADHHFVDYVEHYGPTSADDVSYAGKAIGFAPATMANVSARVSRAGVTLGAEAHHAGRIYVDNTESDENSIAPRTTFDVSLAAARPLFGARTEATFRVQNATDVRYATGGWMDYDENGNYGPLLLPAAPRSWTLALRVDW